MREIKFRAWDKLKREYRYYTIKEIFYLNPTYHQLYFDKHITIEEFTGLKDKNGKEIYEGDIVKVEQNWQDEGKEIWIETTIPEVIEFEDASYIRVTLDKEMPVHASGHDLTDLPYERYEVIGNKFENPELL